MINLLLRKEFSDIFGQLLEVIVVVYGKLLPEKCHQARIEECWWQQGELAGGDTDSSLLPGKGLERSQEEPVGRSNPKGRETSEDGQILPPVHNEVD